MARVGHLSLTDGAAALLDAVALLDVTDDVAVLRVEGADRLDYLHRMLTQDLRGLAPGQAAYACLLTNRGRILGDLWLWCFEDHLRLEVDRAVRAAVLPALERFVIADDVAFTEPDAPRIRLRLAGPGAAAALTAAGLPVPRPGRHAVGAAGTAAEAVGVLDASRRGLPCFELDVAAARAAQGDEALAGLASIARVGAAAWSAACVHAGIPRAGVELRDDVLFNEADLEEAVSWSKGCYPGQEPVVMAKHRGHPPRRLVQLRFDGDEAPVPGAAVRTGGEVVGRVTSGAPRVGARGPAALAYVRHALVVEGARFDVDEGLGAVAARPRATDA